nr:hypothetical protein CFP56_52142 [Quercus suber]
MKRGFAKVPRAPSTQVSEVNSELWVRVRLDRNGIGSEEKQNLSGDNSHPWLLSPSFRPMADDDCDVVCWSRLRHIRLCNGQHTSRNCASFEKHTSTSW